MGRTLKSGSFVFDNPPVITGYGTAVGKKENDGPLKGLFDLAADDMFGKKSFEAAESRMMRHAVDFAVSKSGKSFEELSVVLGGDLLNQCTATSYCVRELERPFIGLFNACATMAEGLGISAAMIDGGFAENVLVTASSHFCSAERQFRFPLEYGGQRPPCAQWTVTGSGAAVVSAKGEGVKITRACIGRIVDLGIDDPNNMGAAMAPAFYDTLTRFLYDTGTAPDDYDLIVSGDLGKIGSEIVRCLFRRDGIELGSVYNDCGLMIYDLKRQDVHSGGSGCGCSSAVLGAKILPEMASGRLKKVLFAGTGALMSPTMLLQKETVAAISHLAELSVT